LVLGIPTKNLMTGNWCFQANVPPGDVRVPTERGNGHRTSCRPSGRWRERPPGKNAFRKTRLTGRCPSPRRPSSLLPWLATV